MVTDWESTSLTSAVPCRSLFVKLVSKSQYRDTSCALPCAPILQVTKVQVTKLVANTYHARVHYAPGPSYRAVAGALPEEMDVDARPSDAINLALRFDAPIYISKEVITQF